MSVGLRGLVMRCISSAWHSVCHRYERSSTSQRHWSYVYSTLLGGILTQLTIYSDDCDHPYAPVQVVWCCKRARLFCSTFLTTDVDIGLFRHHVGPFWAQMASHLQLTIMLLLFSFNKLCATVPPIFGSPIALWYFHAWNLGSCCVYSSREPSH